MSGAVLDAGVLIGIDRGDRRALALAKVAAQRKATLVVPAGCLAQAWRDPQRQARLNLFLRGDHVEVVALDEDAARRIGTLLRRAGTSDVVDAHLVVEGRRRGHAIVTGDGADLRRLDPDAEIIDL